jgi:hypothetical protein
VALLLVATILATSALRPAPAQALTNPEIVGVIFGSLAAYVVIILIATAGVYHHKRRPPQRPPVSPLAEMDREASASASDGFALGPDCPTTSGAMPLACW